MVLEDSLMGSQYITHSEGIPEQAYHAAAAVALDRMLLLGAQGQNHCHMQHTHSTHWVQVPLNYICKLEKTCCAQ